MRIQIDFGPVFFHTFEGVGKEKGRRQAVRIQTVFPLLFAAWFGLSGSVDARLVKPDDPALHYEGRFSADHRFAWTGSLVETDFQGSEISAWLEMARGGAAMLTVVVDGHPRAMKVSGGRKRYLLAKGLDPDKPHRIVLYKRSEARAGTVRFLGFDVPDNARLSPPPPKPLKLLVVGDSITCGYGNEAKRVEEGNTLENENGYMSYAAIAARELGAQMQLFCWSGRGMARNYNSAETNTIPRLYGWTLPFDRAEKWDPARFVPDVVLINLGTNDLSTNHGRKPLEKEPFVTAYRAFLQRLEKSAPGAEIILAIGPMAHQPVQDWLKELAAESENRFTLVFPKAASPDELGGHCHPSVKKDREMADRMVRKIREILSVSRPGGAKK